MATKRTASKKAPAKRATSRKTTSKATSTEVSTVKTEPRSKGRKIIAEFRSKLIGMNGTQLKAFYGGFSAKDLDNQLKAIKKVQDNRSAEEITKTEEEIKRLQEKLAALKK